MQGISFYSLLKATTTEGYLQKLFKEKKRKISKNFKKKEREELVNSYKNCLKIL